MLLKDKVAVIYGAGGAIGGAVARAFARDGARLFLTGRRRAPVEAVAKDIVSAGGSAEAAEVDALDEQAVDAHLQSVIDTLAVSTGDASSDRSAGALHATPVLFMPARAGRGQANFPRCL
jgi:NADP-dependent 3-hydroxy acid dehydrogenase YdfG